MVRRPSTTRRCSPPSYSRAGRCRVSTGGPLLLLAHLQLIVGAALMLLTRERAGWLLPVVLGILGAARGLWSIAWISRIQELIPPGDPRFVGVLTSAGGIIGLLGSGAVGLVVPRLESTSAADPALPAVAVVMVGAGLGFRLLATPLLGWRERRPPAEYAHAAVK